MKKLLIATLAFMSASAFSMAQEQPVVKSDLVLPMFGNKPKTEAQQQKDEKFLTSCDKSFTSRQEASSFFMERGWEYFNEGQVDTAMYRFNLAWLLNPDNKDTYWAFGLVSAAQGNNPEAINYLEKALAYDPKNSLLLADLASSYVAVYKEKRKKKSLKKAGTYAQQAINADTANAYAWYNYSVIKFHEKQYDQAWTYLHKSREIDLTQIDYNFVTELMAQQPDPKGFFKTNHP